MQELKPTKILSTIKGASPFDVLLIIFLFLPIVLGGWILILGRLNLGAETETKFFIVWSGLFIIFSGVASFRAIRDRSAELKLVNEERERIERLTEISNRIRHHIAGRGIKGKPWMSIRQVESYLKNGKGNEQHLGGVAEKLFGNVNEQLFDDLIECFPQRFQEGRSKTGDMLICLKGVSEVDYQESESGKDNS